MLFGEKHVSLRVKLDFIFQSNLQVPVSAVTGSGVCWGVSVSPAGCPNPLSHELGSLQSRVFPTPTYIPHALLLTWNYLFSPVLWAPCATPHASSHQRPLAYPLLLLGPNPK